MEKIKKSLEEKARDILFSLNIPHLNKNGAERSAFHYEMFNQYPPLLLEETISEKEIFSRKIPPERRAQHEPLAIYVHLPFCIKKCTFCCYFSSTGWQRREIDNYLSYLEKEALLLSNKYCLKKRRITSIYWGGGTPAILTCSQINKLSKILRGHFSIGSDAEITCETSPESTTPDKLRCLKDNGFNRISIGVQTFDDKLLNSYHRLHTGDQAIKSFYLSKRLGFSHINIDLMFGLAGQTVDHWNKTLEVVKRLNPANITFYPFSDRGGGSPMSRSSKNIFPGKKEKLLMHIMAIEHFLKAGYSQITPYQFITSWKYSYAHQEHKARNGEIYALGVTGHSFFNDCDFHNVASFSRYKDSLDENRLPVWRGRYLNKKERMIRFIIYGLQKTCGVNRARGGVDKITFKRKFGVCCNDAFKDPLKRLENLRLVTHAGCRLNLSYQGMLLPDMAILFFYLKKDQKAISRMTR